MERYDGKSLELTIALKETDGVYPAGISVIRIPMPCDRYLVQLEELAEIIRGGMENPYTYEHDLLVHKVTLAAARHRSAFQVFPDELRQIFRRIAPVNFHELIAEIFSSAKHRFSVKLHNYSSGHIPAVPHPQ